MKRTALILSLFLGSAAAAMAADVTVVGDVVRYEPGHVIVVRGDGGREMTYTLSPSVVMPSDIATGRHVTLYTDASSGSTVVTRVTTSVTPAGDVKKTVERTTTDPNGDTSRTVTTTISGTVKSYEPGRSVTVTRDDGTAVTYVINGQSQLPPDLAVGRTIHLTPFTIEGQTEPGVRTITYYTVKDHGKKVKKTTLTVQP